MHTLHNIQILRALAAILVLLHHLLPHYHAMGGDLYIIHILSEWGFFGVDIFFVISGFIMAYSTFTKERTYQNAKTFLKHRLFRIYLGYWPFFIAMVILIYVTTPTQIDHLDLLGSLLLINTDMFQLVLPISWSLSYELYFYFLFLFTFIFSIEKLKVIIPIFILMLLASIIYTFYHPTTPEPFFYSHFILEFFSGVILYMYKDTLLKVWLLPFIIVVIFVTLWYGVTYETKNGLFRILTFGTASFGMVYTALILEYSHIYYHGKYLESLGNASYTFYLSHLIILQLFYFSGLRGLFTSTHTILPLLGFLLVILLCIIFSLIYYKKIEKPLYKKAIKL